MYQRFYRFFKIKIVHVDSEKNALKPVAIFSILMCYKAVFLILHVIFNIKTSFLTIVTEINSKVHESKILRIFLNQKSYTYFRR
jgi:hypothetical protein